ncbi:response regulator transcription factor [Gordonia sp. NPDC003950]
MRTRPHPGGDVGVTRVALVDDQELVRAGLRRILRAKDGFEIVAECGDGYEVPDMVAAHRPDVVVMDLRMRRVGGAEATRRLSDCAGAPPVLVLTTYRDEQLLSEALRAGAAGFVLKDSPAEDLIRAVRVVAAGEAVLDPAVTGHVLDAYRSMPVTTDAAAAPDHLTAREMTVLGLIGRGLTNDEIAAELVISVVTVKSHVGKIFTKLGVRDRAAAVIYAFDHKMVTPRA